MTAARRRILIAAITILLVAAISVAVMTRPAAPEASTAKPSLLLLTSLPLMFGEDFSLQQTGSPALTALNSQYRLIPVSTTSAAELAKGKLLLMAQPLGQAPEDLVALDRWVREGGRVLLLADPWLEWPSKRPLGDPLRPPPMFVDTGLLGHWGLRLDAPDERGIKVVKIGEFQVATVSPGSFGGALVARRRIGSGKATVIADADLLDSADLGDAGRQNLDFVLDELARLRSK